MRYGRADPSPVSGEQSKNPRRRNKRRTRGLGDEEISSVGSRSDVSSFQGFVSQGSGLSKHSNGSAGSGSAGSDGSAGSGGSGGSAGSGGWL